MRRPFGSLMAAAMLTISLAVPALADAKEYKVTAPSCFDGESQFLSNPTAVGSMADIRQWINMQRKGGPSDVLDGICETWTGVYTIYQKVDGVWVMFQDKG